MKNEFTPIPFWRTLLQQAGLVLALFGISITALAIVALCFGGGAFLVLHFYPLT